MRVLISGGGIAGLTAANFLMRQGHQTIVIDKATKFNNTGFALSLKSFGVEIMKELGLEDKLRSIAVRSDSVNFFKQNGSLIRELSFTTINNNVADSIMATRGAIHQVIFEAIQTKTEIQFGTTIKTLTQNENGVTIKLSNDKVIEVDLLIVSEGIRSTTRCQVWNDSSVEDLNVFYAAGRLQGLHSHKAGTIQTYLGLKKMLTILPLNDDELAIQCYIHTSANADGIGAIRNGVLSDSFREFNSEVTELIKKLETTGEIFSDKLGIVQEPVLHKGRVVLLGDAGYCPTGLSGMGASLSIFGAKALAHFINNTPNDPNKALEDFNSLMQPVILKFQNNARNNVKNFLPMNNINLWLKNTIISYTPNL